MSKTNPNQDFYKTGGRAQSEGPDKADANVNGDKHELARAENKARAETRAAHPAVMRSKRK